ncbi:MAG: S66 peptidase family protein, partial [Rhodothermales bacterium]
PASAPLSPDHLERGIAHLERLGYRVEAGRPGSEPQGYLAASDDVRLRLLNEALRRPDVKAIFCVRGGYGTLRLLPEIDYAAARRYPKLVIGYSDVTALHLALYAKAGLPGLSGPMVAVDWGAMEAASERLFWELMDGATPQPLLGPGGETLQPVRPGIAEGVLLGGNLTLLTRLIGTPYLPDLSGALLFIEEVGEAPYRIDGLLAHLKLAGILDRLGGLIFGGFTEADPASGRPSLSLDDVIDHYTRDLSCPVAKGLVYGHFPVKNTLPIGVQARLEVDVRTAALSILEPVAV